MKTQLEDLKQAFDLLDETVSVYNDMGPVIRLTLSVVIDIDKSTECVCGICSYLESKQQDKSNAVGDFMQALKMLKHEMLSIRTDMLRSRKLKRKTMDKLAFVMRSDNASTVRRFLASFKDN